MRHRRLGLAFVLTASLTCSWLALHAEAPVDPIVGRWELVGIGEAAGSTVSPDRIVYSFDASGTFDYRLFDHDGGSLDLSGHWTMADDVLRLWPQDGERLKAADQAYRISWDGATMLMHRVDDGMPGQPPFRFARTAAKP